VVDPRLKEFATPKQWAYAQAVAETGSQKAAARKLGLNQSTIGRALIALRKKAAMHGYSPDHDLVHPAAPGFVSRGHSTLYDAATGEAKLQWHKTQRDEQQAHLARQAALEAMLEEVPPAQPIEPVALVGNDLLNLYILTDFHLGMLAWGEETRDEDWDTVKAERLLIDWFTAAIAQAPQADVGLLAQLGDLLHIDSLIPVTPTSHHVLDTSSRFQNIVRVAVRVIKQIIAMLRAKYAHVHVICADANHDPASGVWLREMLASAHIDDTNVTIDTSPDSYYAYSWGATSLFFHHGHHRKPENVESVFAAKFRDVWGASSHSYAHMGHMHHKKAIEGNLMIIEQHRTLAVKDAYSSSRGFNSGRSAAVITYRKQHGEVGRVTLTPEMVTQT
jgi:hypothetical protein